MVSQLQKESIFRAGEVIVLAVLALVLLRISALLVTFDPLTKQFAHPLENGITTLFVLGGLGSVYILGRHRESITEYIPFQKITTTHLFFLWKLLLVTWILAGITSFLLLLIDGGSTGNTNAGYTQQSLATVAASTLVSMLIIGPLEEFFYRGVIQTHLQEYFTPQTAIISASAIFTLSHIMTVQGTPLGQVTYYGLLLGIGIIHGYAYYKTETILAPMLLHGLYNVSIAVLSFV